MWRDTLNLKISFYCFRGKRISTMANYGNNQNFWDVPAAQPQNPSEEFNFDMPEQFGTEL